MHDSNELINQLFEPNYSNDLLNKLLSEVKTMKTTDKITVDLTYINVVDIIDLLIMENIQLELSCHAISMGIEKRKEQRAEKSREG